MERGRALSLQLSQNRNEGKRCWQGLDEQDAAADADSAVNTSHNHAGEAEDQGWSVTNIKRQDDASRQKAIIKALIGSEGFGFAGEFCRCAKGNAGARRFPSKHFQIEEIEVKGGHKETENGNEVNSEIVHALIKAFVGLNVKSICPNGCAYGIMRHERKTKN